MNELLFKIGITLMLNGLNVLLFAIGVNLITVIVMIVRQIDSPEYKKFIKVIKVILWVFNIIVGIGVLLAVLANFNVF